VGGAGLEFFDPEGLGSVVLNLRQLEVVRLVLRGAMPSFLPSFLIVIRQQLDPENFAIYFQD
jgi:hypothetical protein